MIEWFKIILGRTIRRKWRIADGKVESGLDHKFGAPRLQPPHELIKHRSFGPGEQV
jgi:hypothetical protein